MPKYSTDKGENWKDLGSNYAGYRSASLEVIVKEYRKAYLYRCAVSDNAGNIVYSESAKIGESKKPVSIISQPIDAWAEVDESVTFSVEAEKATSYQWQYSADEGENWKDLGSNYTGYRSASLEVTVKTYRKSYLYRCAVSDDLGNTVYSEAAKIDDSKKPTVELFITSQPTDTWAEVDEAITFSVEAEGATSYQWQYSTDEGETWKDLGSNYTGYRTASLEVIVKTYRKSYIYRCAVSDDSGNTVYSEAAKIDDSQKPADGLSIISQPVNTWGELNETVTFAVVAEGANDYQWQYSADEGETWKNLGSNYTGYRSASLEVIVKEYRKSYLYRCAVSDDSGTVVYSNQVKILETN